jgi:acyl-CoA reductase-like NAD-dependent aldehyde dehydrogenase
MGNAQVVALMTGPGRRKVTTRLRHSCGDPARAAALAQRLRTGTTWINHANAVACDDRAPFGGFRQSGIGREMGPDGLLSFTEAHTITTQG